MDKHQLWEATLGELELLISKANFTTWLQHTHIAAVENEVVIIGVANVFTQNYLQNKYHNAILKAMQNVTDGKVKKITYKVETKANAATTTNTVKHHIVMPQEANMPAQGTLNPYGLNSKYVFDTFIVGKNNELANAAAQAIAKQPGQVYNPLFIYGGVGLGKTHLMQSIGNQILKNFPSKKVLYTTSEQFTNDYISSIRSGSVDLFRNKYRKLDVLLIDDIQFMAGKESTQEEFFHTFNEFHQSNRQMVINSDRLPKAIAALEKRLISRLEWGMIADIGTPDFETRMAILRAKCLEKHVDVSEDCLHYIATHVQSNIRELEGALNKIFMQCQVQQCVPTLDLTKQLITSITTTSGKRTVNSKELMKTICEFFDISHDDLIGKSREKKLVVPRQITMYLLREDMKYSYPTIGQELGGRDHTTAMHAYNKICKDIDNEEKTRQYVELLRQRIYG